MFRLYSWLWEKSGVLSYWAQNHKPFGCVAYPIAVVFLAATLILSVFQKEE